VFFYVREPSGEELFWRNATGLSSDPGTPDMWTTKCREPSPEVNELIVDLRVAAGAEVEDEVRLTTVVRRRTP
jgi:hypothetical protein